MKTKFLYLLLSVFLLTTCEKKQPDPPDFSSRIIVTTDSISNISANSAISYGTLSETFGQVVSDYGHCWDTLASPTVEEGSSNHGSIKSGKSFSSELVGIIPDTKYYVRTFFIIGDIIIYGNEINFTTKDGIIILTTERVTPLTATSATSGGTITDDGGATIISRGVCWNTIGNPTNSDNKTINGSGTGSFISKLIGLNEITTYYVRSYATNIYGTGYGQEEVFTTNGIVTDFDGNTYETFRIGNQIWMAENLKVTHYPDGTTIPHVTDNIPWANLGDNYMDDAYCYYDNNSSSEYGALYTFAAALNACPDGWHLPSDAEWTELENYLSDNGYNYDNSIGGGRSKIAKAMATASSWSSSTNTSAIGNDDYPAKRNASGFSALPGGYRYSSNGKFYDTSNAGYWWSRTEGTDIYACYRYFDYNFALVSKDYSLKSNGFSVRCVRDD